LQQKKRNEEAGATGGGEGGTGEKGVGRGKFRALEPPPPPYTVSTLVLELVLAASEKAKGWQVSEIPMLDIIDFWYRFQILDIFDIWFSIFDISVCQKLSILASSDGDFDA